MPTPASVMRDAQAKPALAKRRAVEPGASIASDLGEDIESGSPSQPQTQEPLTPTPPAVPVERPTSVPSTLPVAPPAGKSDLDRLREMVEQSITESPALGLIVRSRGPIHKERVNVTLDPETLSSLKGMALAKGQSVSNFVAETILPWAKSNTDRASLIWGREQLSLRRKIAIQQMREASKGQDLASGGQAEVIYYPLAIFNSLKKTWSESGLKKKGFIESCIFLYVSLNLGKA